jgi:TM2 domain-containing membrane protein YozV
MPFGFIDTKALLETVIASFVAGVGITIVFSVAIFGAARFSELGRAGRNTAAVAYGIVGVVSALAFVAAIVVGIIVMTAK